jgi:site-specific DNA-methyltransferase (adenine-specific)
MVDKLAHALRITAAPLYVMAGYLPRDVEEILHRHPVDAPAVLRERFAIYQPGAAVMEDSSALARPVREELTPSGAVEDHQALYELVNEDCLQWLGRRPDNSVHGIVTDPPYGLKEYTAEEKAKLRMRRGGVWRIPPTLDGATRNPVPRFTVLTAKDRVALQEFLTEWAHRAFRVLVPGAHVFIATNPLLSHIVSLALTEAGFEKRGEIARLVQTLRGGDRPKNAHEEFDMVTVMPRSAWEPWGLFRKPCEGRVQDNLRKWKTGGLRRVSEDRPFCDVIVSAPTRGIEREIAPHPSLKPQGFMRQVVRAALPFGEGIVLDPFMGAGSTIAAACALGYRSIGVESDADYFRIAVSAVPRLAALRANGNGNVVGRAEAVFDYAGQRGLF